MGIGESMNHLEQSRRLERREGFTLLELLIVVAIIAILAGIAVVNLREASERALRAADMANLRVIGSALQSYLVDYGKLPPADRIAGPFQSHMETAVGNGPAGGGSQDGIPWMLYDLKYIGKWETLFCPKYLRLYPSGKTPNGYPRYHNFRYAYNTTALSSQVGSQDNRLMSGTVWLVRDLYVAPGKGWPNLPSDYKFPWGDGDMENVLAADMTVKLYQGGVDTPPSVPLNP